MKARPPYAFSVIAAALAIIIPAGFAGGGNGVRDYGAADRLIGEMENEISCLVSGFLLETRGVRPTVEQREFRRALGYIDHAVDDLRYAFKNDRGYSRLHNEFNQLENKFKGANRLRDRARVSPSVRRHLDSLNSAIAAFKRLKSSQYGVGE